MSISVTKYNIDWQGLSKVQQLFRDF